MKVIIRNARNLDFFVSRKNIFKINSYIPFLGTVVFSKLFFEEGIFLLNFPYVYQCMEVLHVRSTLKK